LIERVATLCTDNRHCSRHLRTDIETARPVSGSRRRSDYARKKDPYYTRPLGERWDHPHARESRILSNRTETISESELAEMLENAAITRLRGFNRRYFHWLFKIEGDTLVEMQHKDMVEVGKGPRRCWRSMMPGLLR
jgi:hypothetical protein